LSTPRTMKILQASLLRRIVGEDEFERYLAEGWDVQTVLPSGRILIKRLG